MPQKNFQLTLPDSELDRLKSRIEADYTNALSDHDRRLTRHMEQYRRWRNRYTPNPESEADKPNFQVPLTKWHVYAKWAKEMEALFGDDAEILGTPHGPADERQVRKVSRYMTWRFFTSMRAVRDFSLFGFRKILFGRSHAYAPWKRETFMVPREFPIFGSILRLVAGGEQEVVHYEGPGFDPLWPDDFMHPAEDVKTLQQFSWIIHKHVETVDELLRGEQEQRYREVRKHLDELLHEASQGRRRDQDEGGDQIKAEKDEGEGVTHENALSARSGIRVHTWYGRWRNLKSGIRDVQEFDAKLRQPMESELLVHFVPSLKLILGVQDLKDLYPSMKDRRPFVEASMPPDGSYWPAGFGEMLSEIEEEMTVNHNLGIEGGQMSVGPVIFYRPAAGFKADRFKYEPYDAIPVDNPQTDVNVVTFRADLNFPITHAQTLQSYAERVTGVTDLNLGRTQDRPNAPRTVGQTVALLEEGNVRAALDTRMLREDAADILQYMWRLDTNFAPKGVFFRVTEEDAGGLFKVDKGGAELMRSDREGGFDFHLKFATSAASREVRRERALQLYQLDINNPLIANNPRALWLVTRQIHEEFGDRRFAALIPEPPDVELSIPPKEELARIQAGEEIAVRPMDDDQGHITAHFNQLALLQGDEQPNPEVVKRLSRHYLEHVRQLQQKKLMQALTQNVTESLPALQQQLGPLVPSTQVSPDFGRDEA